MLKIYLNGDAIEIATPPSLQQALVLWGYQHADTFAVAINQAFVPKQLYAQTVLQTGDHIDIVAPMQGG
jgi:sulfur carrier protein